MSFNKIQAVADKFAAYRREEVTPSQTCVSQCGLYRRKNVTVNYGNTVVSITGGKMSVFQAQTIVDKWAACRMKTVSSLRSCAIRLEMYHKENATEELDSAVVSLTGDFIGLGGILLAPFSGGLSLGLCGLSATMGLASFVNKREANKRDGVGKNEVQTELKRVLDIDQKETTKIKELCERFEYLERQFQDNINRIDGINVEDIQSQSQVENISVLGITTQLVNLNAALTSGAKQVVTCTTSTNEVIKGTRTVKKIVSTAKTVSETAGTSVSTLTKGADTTIKTAKQASQTVKTVTQVATETSLTTHATKITKVTETATKAASISKLGLAINAVVIPLDLYNLVVASENLEKSFEDVNHIKNEADRLKREIENMRKVIDSQVVTFTKRHMLLCEVYKSHHNEDIYAYLLMMNEELEFTLPNRY